MEPVTDEVPVLPRMDPKGRRYMDNEPACGAPKGWVWGYLPCGCRNDGWGNHLR